MCCQQSRNTPKQNAGNDAINNRPVRNRKAVIKYGNSVPIQIVTAQGGEEEIVAKRKSGKGRKRRNTKH